MGTKQYSNADDAVMLQCCPDVGCVFFKGCFSRSVVAVWCWYGIIFQILIKKEIITNKNLNNAGLELLDLFHTEAFQELLSQ